MPITPLQRKRIQQALVAVLLLVILVTAGVLWWGFFVTSSAVPEGPALPVRRVDVNTSILTNPLLQELEEPKALPSIPSDVGRENPLLPSPLP